MNELLKILDEVEGVLDQGVKYKSRISSTLSEFGKIATDVAAENLGETTTAVATKLGAIFTKGAALIG